MCSRKGKAVAHRTPREITSALIPSRKTLDPHNRQGTGLPSMATSKQARGRPCLAPRDRSPDTDHPPAHGLSLQQHPSTANDWHASFLAGTLTKRYIIGDTFKTRPLAINNSDHQARERTSWQQQHCRLKQPKENQAPLQFSNIPEIIVVYLPYRPSSAGRKSMNMPAAYESHTAADNHALPILPAVICDILGANHNWCKSVSAP